MRSAVYASNLSNSLRVIEDADALTQTIGATPVAGETDPALQLDRRTDFLLCQTLGDEVWVNFHKNPTPAQGNAILIAPKTIFVLSRSEWLGAVWMRVTSDAILTAQQMGAS